MKEIFAARVYVDGQWFFLNQDKSAWDATAVDEAYQFATYPVAVAALGDYVPDTPGCFGAVDKFFTPVE